VAERSGGRAEVEVFHNSELGNEREMAEMVKTDALEMTISGLAGIGLYVPGIHVFELPYLYGSMAELKEITAKLEPEMQKLLVDKGFRTLGFNFQGPRSTASVKPLQSFADFKGLRLRVPESPLYVGMAKAMGTDPTPVAYPEVYTALQSGVVEAMEGGPDSVYNNRFYEVAKNYVLTKHIFHVLYMAINEEYFQSLPADIREVLLQAGHEASEAQYRAVLAANEESLERMRAEGTRIIEIDDIAPFRAAMQSFNVEYAAGKGAEAEAMLRRITELTR
jgi:tripartite ATP-independent transporter DctP family solute receptor